jgi:hypothetical protein
MSKKTLKQCSAQTQNNVLFPAACMQTWNLSVKASFMPKNQDIVVREFNIARKINAFILFIDGMVDKNSINSLCCLN